MTIQKIVEGLLHSENAGEDLSTYLNYFVKMHTDGTIMRCGDGEAALGTLVEGAISGKPVTVQFGGIGKVICAEAITPGAILASDANAKAVAAAAGDFVAGIALNTSASSAGDLVPFAFVSGRRHA